MCRNKIVTISYIVLCKKIVKNQNIIEETGLILFHALNLVQVIGKNGGEDTLAHWPTASGVVTIDDASLQILKYLDNTWGTLSSSGSLLIHHLKVFFLYKFMHFQRGSL